MQYNYEIKILHPYELSTLCPSRLPGTLDPSMLSPSIPFHKRLKCPSFWISRNSAVYANRPLMLFDLYFLLFLNFSKVNATHWWWSWWNPVILWIKGFDVIYQMMMCTHWIWPVFVLLKRMFILQLLTVHFFQIIIQKKDPRVKTTLCAVHVSLPMVPSPLSSCAPRICVQIHLCYFLTVPFAAYGNLLLESCHGITYT